MVFQMRQKDRRDANVVVDDLSFRKTRRRIQHLIEVRNHDLFTCTPISTFLLMLRASY